MKVTNEEAKLLREGKSIANYLNTVSSGDNFYSHIIQISRLKAYFSTVSYVGHDLHVGVLQNQIISPSCIGELNDFTKSFIYLKTLFQFRNGIEDTAHTIQSKIIQMTNCSSTTSNKFSNLHLISPPRTTPQLLSQTGYTHPEKGTKENYLPRLQS